MCDGFYTLGCLDWACIDLGPGLKPLADPKQMYM